MAVICIISQRIVGVRRPLFKVIIEVEDIEGEGDVVLLGVAVAAVEVGVALVQANLRVLEVEEQAARGVRLLLVGLVGAVL